VIEAWGFAWEGAAGSRVLPWCSHVNTPTIGRHSQMARKSFGYDSFGYKAFAGPYSAAVRRRLCATDRHCVQRAQRGQVRHERHPASLPTVPWHGCLLLWSRAAFASISGNLHRTRPRSGLRTWADALPLVPAVATSQARFQRQRVSSPSV
jgi:hypothetical protein